jgi:hypothetical protein
MYAVGLDVDKCVSTINLAVCWKLLQSQSTCTLTFGKICYWFDGQSAGNFLMAVYYNLKYCQLSIYCNDDLIAIYTAIVNTSSVRIGVIGKKTAVNTKNTYSS